MKTGERKTIKRSKLGLIAMVNGGEKTVEAVILEGEVMRWVGIGWLPEGRPTEEQERELPHVVDD